MATSISIAYSVSQLTAGWEMAEVLAAAQEPGLYQYSTAIATAEGQLAAKGEI